MNTAVDRILRWAKGRRITDSRLASVLGVETKKLKVWRVNPDKFPYEKRSEFWERLLLFEKKQEIGSAKKLSALKPKAKLSTKRNVNRKRREYIWSQDEESPII